MIKVRICPIRLSRLCCHGSQQALNGVWVDDNKLFVEEACFGVNEGNESFKWPKAPPPLGPPRKSNSNPRPEVNGKKRR